MPRNINLTSGRRSWLIHLRDNGPSDRSGRGNIGFNCMSAGWTEWVYQRKDKTVGTAALRAGYGPDGYLHWALKDGWKLTHLEQITIEGLAILEEGVTV